MHNVIEWNSYLNRPVLLFSEVNLFFIENGVVVKNSKQSCKIEGKSSHILIVRLIHLLNGVNTISDILPADEGQAEVVLAILSAFIQRRFVVLLEEPLIDSRFFGVYQFLSLYTSCPVTILRNFQGSSFYCIGSGVLLRNLLNILTQYGANAIQVHCPQEEREDLNLLFNNLEFVLEDKLQENKKKYVFLASNDKVFLSNFSRPFYAVDETLCIAYHEDDFLCAEMITDDINLFNRNQKESVVSPVASAALWQTVLCSFLLNTIHPKKKYFKKCRINPFNLQVYLDHA